MVTIMHRIISSICDVIFIIEEIIGCVYMYDIIRDLFLQERGRVVSLGTRALCMAQASIIICIDSGAALAATIRQFQ